MDDYDAVFSTVRFASNGVVPSLCHEAIALTTRKYADGFPGWQIYYRLVSGNELFDRSICAYFEGLGRTLARCRTKTGRDYISASVRRNDWIRQASRDAMDFVLFGRYFRADVDESEGLKRRAARFNIGHTTYKKIRDPIGIGMRLGMDSWISELHYQFSQILFRQKVTPSILAL